MGAKVSPEMLKARKLVESGRMSAYAAAAECGITRQAIYASDWFKELRHGQAKKPPSPGPRR